MPGGSVNITCLAVGSPMPYVKWMLGAEDLTPEDDMPIGRNVLELTDIRQSNNYTCVAMSTLGVIEAVAQIIVKGGFIHTRRLIGDTRKREERRGQKSELFFLLRMTIIIIYSNFSYFKKALL